MQFLWRYIDELVGKGLEMKVIAELLLYTSASLVPMALPLSILMSSLMTFGNMGEFYELTAIKASGISLKRIMMPLFVVVFVISLGAFFFANNVMPFTNLKMRSLLYDVRKQRPEIIVVPGTFYNGMDGYSIRVDNKDPKTNVLYNIKIYDHTARKGNISVLIADSATMIITEDKRNLILTLYHGYSYNEMQEETDGHKNKTYPHRYDRFSERQLIIEMVGFGLERTNENLFKTHYQMMSLSQLGDMKDSITIEIADRQSYLYKNLIHNNFFRKREFLNREIPRDIPLVDTTTLNKFMVARKDGDRNFQGENQLHKRIEEHRRKNINNVNIKTFAEQDTLKSTSVPKSSEEKPKQIAKLNNQLPPNTDYFSLLTIKEQNRILDEALNYARSTRSYVMNSLQTVEYKEEQLRKYEIEWQRKFTISFACMVFLLIGAPLGAIIRKGGLGFPLVISTLSFIFYYIISLFSEKMVRESILPDYQGMWFAPFLFLITGIFLTYKATTDASILNMDTYANFFKKIAGKRRRSLIETLNQENVQFDMGKHIKEENLVGSLLSLIELTNENIETIQYKLKPAGFIASLIEMQGNSDIILFERFYKNSFTSIVQSDLYNNKAIRLKLFSLPGFNARHYADMGYKFYLKIIFLFLPPVTIIVIIREYFLLHMILSKFKAIYNATSELLQLIKNYQQ